MVERPTRGRDTGLVWGVIAWVCAGTVLLLWVLRPDPDGQIPFGRTAAVAMLAVALLVTAAAAVASVVIWYASRDWPAALRRGLALAAGAGGLLVAVLGVGGFASAGTSAGMPATIVQGSLLLFAALGMCAVAVHVGRARATGGLDRLRQRFAQRRGGRS